jgi:hypothetical protein
MWKCLHLINIYTDIIWRNYFNRVSREILRLN